MYEHVIIPNEVANELAAAYAPLAATLLLHQDWIEIRSVSNQHKVLNLFKITKLDLGEYAAITLAQELQADRLLLDDLAARKEAQRRGLPVIGTVGIVLIAKQLKLIPNIKQVLDDLIANGTRISQQLYQQILTAAGE
ncbi:MAG: DUF3368 domain-containing protein [Rhizonema sp. PD38]|nr:DUF3368 domain-containing protein [Rhizonema sp. PD38]